MDAAPIVAQWYFDEFGGEDTVEFIAEKLLLGRNRNELPILYLARSDGKLVGAGELKFREIDMFPNYKYWLDGIFVKPSHRGQGISSKLIEFGLSKAKFLGLSQLHLRCADYNVKLYEKHGFKTVAVDNARFIMELQLNT